MDEGVWTHQQGGWHPAARHDNPAPCRPEGAAEGAAPAVAVEVQRLRDENAALHDALQALALATLPPELHTELRAGALSVCVGGGGGSPG